MALKVSYVNKQAAQLLFSLSLGAGLYVTSNCKLRNDVKLFSDFDNIIITKGQFDTRSLVL